MSGVIKNNHKLWIIAFGVYSFSSQLSWLFSKEENAKKNSCPDFNGISFYAPLIFMLFLYFSMEKLLKK